MMAQVSYKVENGPGGGYLPYVRIVSPLLKEDSGEWFLVLPGHRMGSPAALTRFEDLKQCEHSSYVLALETARAAAVRLADQATKRELAFNVTEADRTESSS
ncbi:MAG: hypothetical protein AB1898_13960 [Acidobacteriota bacterium]